MGYNCYYVPSVDGGCRKELEDRPTLMGAALGISQNQKNTKNKKKQVLNAIFDRGKY